MNLQDAVVEWAGRFEAAKIEYWLFGGWAVDYHVGRVTRDHSDVDFVIWARDHEAVTAMLNDAGYAAVRPPLAWERDGATIELTLIEATEEGLIVTPGFEDWPWDPGTFEADMRSLHGSPVRVVSVAGLLAVKQGWQDHFDEAPRPQDLADIQALSGLPSS